MSKKPSIDLVGRLAAHIDLNAAPETAEAPQQPKRSRPEIAPEIPVALAPERSPVMSRAVEAVESVTLQTPAPAPPTQMEQSNIIVDRAIEAAARKRGFDPDHPPHLSKVTRTL